MREEYFISIVMNADKKNQHYLPKFYLRNFSYQKNLKQIGIYNLNNEFYCKTAKLKTQGSKNFFYGHDGVIEDVLANIEGELSRVIRQILKQNIPKKDSDDYLLLLNFTILTYLRNPIAIESVKESNRRMREEFLKKMPEEMPKEKFDNAFPSIEHSSAITIALSQLKDLIPITTNLEYKLLINKTDTPFIASDSPIVRYNQHLEEQKHYRGKTGFGSLGLQIFIPISPDITIIFYDSKIYRVGDKKKKYLEIRDTASINQLNLLQVLNCTDTLFFDEKISEHYIKSLVVKSKQYQRGNQIKVSSLGNIAMSLTMSSEIRLKLSGVKKLSGVNIKKLNKAQLQVRPLARKFMERRG